MATDIDADSRALNAPDVGADEVAAAAGVDTVSIDTVIYDPTLQRLTVVATSDQQPDVSLSVIAYINDNPVSLGNLDWKSWLQFYRNTFNNVTVRPSSILVTSSAGGSATYNFAAADTVTIQDAIYDHGNQRLTVIATSNHQNVELTAVNYGDLAWKSWLGFYRNTFNNVPRPESVTVISSDGGSDTFTLPAVDTVTIQDVVHDNTPGNQRLTVIATSDRAGVELTAVGYGDLAWKSWLGFYRNTFNNVPRPESVTVTSSGGGSATFNLPAADIVTIDRAVYDANNQTLMVIATSNQQPNVQLYSDPGGKLAWKSWLNFYRTTFSNVGANPGTVTVTSSGGGSSTIDVTQ